MENLWKSWDSVEPRRYEKGLLIAHSQCISGGVERDTSGALF